MKTADDYIIIFKCYFNIQTSSAPNKLTNFKSLYSREKLEILVLTVFRQCSLLLFGILLL